MDRSARLEALEVATRLALDAGQQMLEARQKSVLKVERKGRVDLVTQVDHAVQERILRGLREALPDHAIVAEESERAIRPDPQTPAWFVDPIDGTTNYVHGYPFYATSLGLCLDGIPQVGVVYAPALDELYCATLGGGATLSRPMLDEGPRPLRHSGCVELGSALCATGFPYHRDQRARLALALVARLLHEARGIRRAGAAAIDLCHVATGQLDAYLELNLSPWDLAAGALIAREAGALVSDWEGQDHWLWGRRILAAAPELHPELLGVLERVHAEPEAWPIGEPLPADLDLKRMPGEVFPWE